MHIEQLLKIMQQLREQCPWDQAQTPQSLTGYAIEEAYEVAEAVHSGDAQHVREELGDLLLQVVFQSQMYQEQGAFGFDDVVQTLSEKLIRRHPHVFEPEQFKALSAEQVSHLWQEIKQQECQGKAPKRLDAIKPGPALLQAQAIQKNTAKIGFDFADVEGAYAKFEEELAEFKQACEHQNSDEMLDELGDCLFSLINVGRKLDLCAETALLSTIGKVKNRFAYIEDQAQLQNKDIQSMSLQEMDQLWDQAKLALRSK
ncbi:MazG family protein [Acinetobacter calcoaceticus]|uniref:MazG family protein n=1 Tax=Acinetobacter calcoaceticus TaxID=471 RepID=A0A4R1XWS5_ACICA|nr:MazG family protein [Acinetobacter calcoaceticus]